MSTLYEMQKPAVEQNPVRFTVGESGIDPNANMTVLRQAQKAFEEAMKGHIYQPWETFSYSEARGLLKAISIAMPALRTVVGPTRVEIVKLDINKSGEQALKDALRGLIYIDWTKLTREQQSGLYQALSLSAIDLTEQTRLEVRNVTKDHLHSGVELGGVNVARTNVEGLEMSIVTPKESEDLSETLIGVFVEDNRMGPLSKDDQADSVTLQVLVSSGQSLRMHDKITLPITTGKYTLIALPHDTKIQQDLRDQKISEAEISVVVKVGQMEVKSEDFKYSQPLPQLEAQETI